MTQTIRTSTGRRITAAALALAGMAAMGVGALATTDATQPVLETEIAQVADGELSFPVGKYMSHRVSDHVKIPAGTVLQFSNLPPGLSYDPATTAIHGTPTTPGVYNTTGTAYIAGVPVRTATVKVTITGGGGGNPAPQPNPQPNPRPNPQPSPNPAPQPGTPGIDPAMVHTLPLPPEVKALILQTIEQINDGIRAAWEAVPAGSLGK